MWIFNISFLTRNLITASNFHRELFLLSSRNFQKLLKILVKMASNVMIPIAYKLRGRAGHCYSRLLALKAQYVFKNLDQFVAGGTSPLDLFRTSTPQLG